MSFANIGMNPGYMSRLPRYSAQPQQIYTSLQGVSGLRAGLNEPEQWQQDLQPAVGALQMANTANNAIKGLTGTNVAKELQDWATSDPTAFKEALGGSVADWSNDLPADFVSQAIPADFTDLTPDMFGPSVNLADFSNMVDASSMAADGASGFLDGFDLGGATGYLGPLSRLAQGDEWGALGSAIGTYFGGPIGGMIGAQFGPVLDDVGHFVDDAVGEVGDFVEDVFDFGGGCVIASELVRQGKWKASRKAWVVGYCMKHWHQSDLFNTMRAGYRTVGKPIVEKMKTSEKWTKSAKRVFEKFTDHFSGRKKSVEGFAYTCVLLPIFATVGYTLKLLKKGDFAEPHHPQLRILPQEV